jgi:hypothetical protein
MEHPSSLPGLSTRVRRLRLYRLLTNSFVTLLAFALLLLLLRWLFPWIFAFLVLLWTADTILLVVLAVPWLLVSSGLALGRIVCPSCAAPFTSRFHLWVPKTCQKCGYDITALPKGATSNTGAGRDSW